MSTTWEQLEGAAVSLARAGSIKDRLTDAFRNHLAQIDVEELPDPLRAQYRACHEALTRERPQRGEDAVRATVRKMSTGEADEVASNVVRLYGAFAREWARETAPLTERGDERRGGQRRHRDATEEGGPAGHLALRPRGVVLFLSASRV